MSFTTADEARLLELRQRAFDGLPLSEAERAEWDRLAAAWQRAYLEDARAEARRRKAEGTL